MGATALKIGQARANIAKAGETIVKETALIAQLQQSCPHPVWRFVYQVNAYHNLHWRVHYCCNECDSSKVETKKPVCEICDVTLVRAVPGDEEAHQEKMKPENQGNWNPPIAFRCPSCKKIHVLFVLGD